MSIDLPPDEASLRDAAQAFTGLQDPLIRPLGNGLIHQTYRVSESAEGPAIVLQRINRSVFSRPEDIVYNYGIIYDFLQKNGGPGRIPAPVKAGGNQLLWLDGKGNAWRATTFLNHTRSPQKADNEASARTVAGCFAGLTAALEGLDPASLRPVLPGFHDLSQRYLQFEAAVSQAGFERLMPSTHLVSALRERAQLVRRFESYRNPAEFPLRIMHHDCKITNILFDTQTEKVVCPVDLDTMMAGKFFSDPGDMIRTMACSQDENSRNWDEIRIVPLFYEAILDQYLVEMGSLFTAAEKAHIHDSGLMMIYMQSLRFLTDFLQEDKYYRTEYPGQNLNRALNQLILLESLEVFLSELT